MNDVDIAKIALQKLLKEKAEHFPFIAQYWNIEIYEQDQTISPLEFGCFFSRLNVSIQFYKPFSRIIDFSKLESE